MRYFEALVEADQPAVNPGRTPIPFAARMATLSLAAETADVGMDAYSPVTDDYEAWANAFNGAIK